MSGFALITPFLCTITTCKMVYAFEVHLSTTVENMLRPFLLVVHFGIILVHLHLPTRLKYTCTHKRCVCYRLGIYLLEKSGVSSAQLASAAPNGFIGSKSENANIASSTTSNQSLLPVIGLI